MSPNDWEQMPYFLAVARAGSLRGAAEALGTTHVKVNRHINALEAAYGVALVRRSQRGISLTPAGAKLLPIAEDAEGTFLHARRSLMGLDQQMTGDIHFSTSGPLGFVNPWRSFPTGWTFRTLTRPYPASVQRRFCSWGAFTPSRAWTSCSMPGPRWPASTATGSW